MLDMGFTLTARLGIVGLASVLMAACAQVPIPQGQRASAPTSPQARTAASATPASTASGRANSTPKHKRVNCSDLVEMLSPAEQVGQLLMVAVRSTGLRQFERDALAASRAGSVILLGNSFAGAAATRRVVTDARRSTPPAEGIETLMAVDQEGGKVQRLRGPGFAEIPPAEQQAERSDARLAADAERWGDDLAAVGIGANLAPVADVVSADLAEKNAPIGYLRRGYGSSPRTVAAKATAFARGMDRAGMATAVKHFPGLGRVRGNTDYARRVVDDQTRRDDPNLAPFAAAVDGGVDMVMASSAFYDKIDQERRAAFSPVVLGDMLRGELGFTGVVISDDLAAEAMVDVDPAQRALRFLGAGGDLMIIGDPGLVAPMVRAVRQQMSDDEQFAERVRQSATRVVALKARRGLATCAG